MICCNLYFKKLEVKLDFIDKFNLNFLKIFVIKYVYYF